MLLTMLLTLFDSQTQSKLSIDELMSLRKLLGALLAGVREARRAATGAAAAPFNAKQESLPSQYARLLDAVETRGFRLKWPRLFADATFVEAYFQSGRVAITADAPIGPDWQVVEIRSSAVPLADAAVELHTLKSIWTTPDAVRKSPRIYK